MSDTRVDRDLRLGTGKKDLKGYPYSTRAVTNLYGWVSYPRVGVGIHEYPQLTVMYLHL